MNKTSEILLRRLIREAVAASMEYMKKEDVRKEVQDKILKYMFAGRIEDQDDLDTLLQSLDTPRTHLAVTTLRSVPFDVWMKLLSNY
jgi:hypothetical protein